MARKITRGEGGTLRIEERSVVDLSNDPVNARKHNEKNIQAIIASLRRFGQQKPIVIDANNVVRAGNGTLEAARQLGWESIQCVITTLQGSEAIAYAIADNRTAELAEWDDEILAAQLNGLLSESEEIALAAGFTADEIEAMVSLSEDNPPVIEDDPSTDPAPSVTKPGDLWILGDHRLLCGDSTIQADLDRLMGADQWSLCVTSPPYNQKLDAFKPSGMHTETKWVSNVSKGSYFDSKPEQQYQIEQVNAVKAWITKATENASVFYNHKNRYREKQVVSPWIWLTQTGLKVRQEIIWKREGSVTQNARMFMPCDERIYWLYVGDDFYFDDSTEHKTWSSVWQINSHKDREESMHGCAFPMELASRPIRACSKMSEIVLEPYCGSGTTMIAAEQLGRKCYGMEISPVYCDVIIARWEKFTGLKAVLES